MTENNVPWFIDIVTINDEFPCLKWLVLCSFRGDMIEERVICPRGIMVKALDWGIVVSKFELKSGYFVNFRRNTLGKDMNSLILPAMG